MTEDKKWIIADEELQKATAEILAVLEKHNFPKVIEIGMLEMISRRHEVLKR